jgi:hypothetical protein
MRLDINWLDELDEDELEVDRSGDDVLTDETGPLDYSEISDDELDVLDVEFEPEALPAEDGFDVAAHYFQESARHRLLSAGQERELTLAVERGCIARKRLERSRPALSETTRRQLRREIELALLAREELVRSNARLVISVAKRYQNLGLPFMDLIQEATSVWLAPSVGLSRRAVCGFQPMRPGGCDRGSIGRWPIKAGRFDCPLTCRIERARCFGQRRHWSSRWAVRQMTGSLPRGSRSH